ncbi:MAG: GNAT family N-acetyltransferase [Enterococcus sp.]
MMDVQIIEWEDKYAEQFKRLSLEWLEKYVSVEPADLEIINNPHKSILEKGGMIFFALCDGLIVGTVAMIRQNDGSFELAKLAVTEGYKGLKLGNLLMEKSLEFASQRKATTVFLYTNRRLLPAINLYEKFGFKEIPIAQNKYIEADMKMELKF